jgi:hypothetical protein
MRLLMIVRRESEISKGLKKERSTLVASEKAKLKEIIITRIKVQGIELSEQEQSALLSNAYAKYHSVLRQHLEKKPSKRRSFTRSYKGRGRFNRGREINTDFPPPNLRLIADNLLNQIVKDKNAKPRRFRSLIDIKFRRLTKFKKEHLHSDTQTETINLNLESSFNSLAEKWYLETIHSSGYLDKVLHPAYQRIIGLGKDIIPFILRELQDEPSEWFWALRALTGEDPTTEDMAGNREKLAEAWLNWGKENGYI